MNTKIRLKGKKKKGAIVASTDFN